MKKSVVLILIFALGIGMVKASDLPDTYAYVDQVIWVVSDVEATMAHYSLMGFDQFKDLGIAEITSYTRENTSLARIMAANLGGAHVNWIQPLDGESVFQDFHMEHGDAAMSLVHRFLEVEDLKSEMERLDGLGVGVLDKISIKTAEGELAFVLMDTEQEGKYVLGFTYGDNGLQIHTPLCDINRLELRLSQYAFAIRDPELVSDYWEKIGLPGLEISHPQLGNPKYYGQPADHELTQGWQRHGDIPYEWCIPVKAPIVYEDHIRKHGEGIHHLAFSVEDMDAVLEDFNSQGFVVSMGGTWGETGKPGSGRYEYIDLEMAGGLTMELLWSYRE